MYLKLFSSARALVRFTIIFEGMRSYIPYLRKCGIAAKRVKVDSRHEFMLKVWFFDHAFISKIWELFTLL